ncbi:MAG TPA: hypothetical protein RMH85_06180 [Polyangiaceae bacterium LLY-WYZ-15_(1-7)]|nr:hypothetical protein [Sandaracinus sp.]HJL05677.1 hypothetical protein [Polyangiaceae bacterium LLY-WYZ-15_(1-7)]MBJ70002.1 hypothetical protein [Sandaracinus sp.]HJL08065.1 hypothetical protein [Polyangiaceae bacterium LLY-WYZ-15_(1-7)]HJL26180.1 hypothetical protein [Polyangiaceae bacterium LLY-WYZ-15_(1-7)]
MQNTMQHAYRLSAAAVRRRYAEQRPETLQALDGLRQADVAVYTGTYDSVQNVLKALGVPHTLDPKRLRQRIVFANCAGSYPAGRLKELEAHVRAGALLVTSDWALSRLVQRAFPGMVRRATKSTGDEVVGVEPTMDGLWSEVVVLGADPQWWLEGSSEPIEVLDEAKVCVEASSHECLAKYGAPAVAVSFPWGCGRVFHVMSHFWLKRTRAGGRRHGEPGAAFLRDGMRLGDEAIRAAAKASGVDPNALSFATVQSAATSTELVARLVAS